MDEDDERQKIVSFEKLADLIAYLQRLYETERRHFSEMEKPSQDLDLKKRWRQ